LRYFWGAMDEKVEERIYGENVTFRQKDSSKEHKQQNGNCVQLRESGSPRNELSILNKQGLRMV
jgi:hypothetical protein